jgi:hypothetical protein
MALFQEILAAMPTAANLAEKVKTVEFQRDEFKQERDNYKRLYDECQSAYQKLTDIHSEDVVLHNGVEFRKGRKTGNKWQAFCPVCHDVPLQLMPAPYEALGPICPKCKFRATFRSSDMVMALRLIDAAADIKAEPQVNQPTPESLEGWRAQSRQGRLHAIELFKKLNLPLLPAYIQAHEELEREARERNEIPPATN